MSVQLIDWDLALIQKYNYSGPRYTSYPTALEFSPEFGAAEFDAAVARYPQRPLSLYVHIPFCHKLCYFCGCNKIVTRQQHKADQYRMCWSRKLFIARRSLPSVRCTSCTGAAVLPLT